MERIYYMEELEGKVIKKTIESYGHIAISFTDGNYIIISAEDLSEIELNHDLDYSEEYGLGLITFQEYQAKLKAEDEERLDRQRRVDMNNYEYIKKKYNL